MLVNSDLNFLMNVEHAESLSFCSLHTNQLLHCTASKFQTYYHSSHSITYYCTTVIKELNPVVSDYKLALSLWNKNKLCSLACGMNLSEIYLKQL